MSVARTCPDWPELMELDPDLQFKHYTVAEAQLPADVLARMTCVSLADVEICCDLEKHVFNPAHTDTEVCDALRDSHWFDVHEWSTSGPGASDTGPSVTGLDAEISPEIDLGPGASHAA